MTLTFSDDGTPFKGSGGASGMEGRIRDLRHRVDQLNDELFAMEAQLAHERGYIGVDATRKFFSESGVSLD